MVFLFKPIKPKKLNDKAILDELLKEASNIANDIELDYLLTVGTWKRKVKFENIIDGWNKDGISILVATDDEIYRYVNDGTEEHVILPKNAVALRFKSGYRAKTLVGSAVSRNGGSFGETVYSKGVLHPGTEARKFDEIIEKDWNKRFKRRMEKALKRARKVSDNPI